MLLEDIIEVVDGVESRGEMVRNWQPLQGCGFQVRAGEDTDIMCA